MSSGLFSNLIWKFSERILAQGISFIVSLILARILSPEQFGIVALVLIFINLADAIVVSGFNTSLIQKKSADDEDFSTVFWFCLFLSIILYLIIFFLSEYIAIFFKEDMLVPVFKVIGLRLIISSFNSIQHAYVSRKLQFKKYFFSTSFGTIVSTVVGIYMAFNGYGVWALVFQYLINSIIDTIVLFLTIDWKPKLFFSFYRLKLLFSFGWKILFDAIFGTLQSNLRNFFIGKVYSKSDLAYYTKSQNIPNLFYSNISTSISSVLLPAMSNVNDDEKTIIKYISKASKLSAYVMFPMLLGIILISKEFVIIFLTEKWLPMVPFLYLYCIICMFNVLMTQRNEGLKAIGRSDVFLLEHTLYRFIDIVVLFFLFNFSPIVLMFSALCTSLFLLLLIMYNTHKYNHYKFYNQIFDLKNTMFSCIVMFVSVHLVSLIKINLYVIILIKIIVGAFAYFFISYICSFEEFDMITCLLKEYFIRGKNKIKMVNKNRCWR